MTKLRDFDRAELLRLARMRRCHEEDRPTAREIERALARLGETRLRRRGQRVTRVLALAAAVLLSTLGAFATTEKLGLTALIARWQSKETPSVAPAVPPRPSVRLPLPPRASEHTASPEAALDPPSSASAPAPRAPLRTTPGARTLEAAPRSTSGPGEAWEKAAAALKLGDQPRAQEALSELARSDDPETRAAALLARAELDLVTGEEQRARAVLNALAERGATPFVRMRARQILAGER
jgi:hypothetical protein